MIKERYELSIDPIEVPEEDFDVSEDDIKHCHFAIECILEDLNYDCYLEGTK